MGGRGGVELRRRQEAAAALKIDWDKGPYANVSDQSIIDESRRCRKTAPKACCSSRTAISAAAMGKAAKVIEGEYLTSLNIHAPLEPMNALAMERERHLAHLYRQSVHTRTTLIAAAVAGVDPENVVIHQHYLGGGFGRRLESDMTVPAVAAAKAVGKPVKLIYAREDDMQMDFTRPLTYQKVKVGLDAEGHAIAMEHDVIGAWPTARWGIPAFLTPAVDKKGRMTASRSTAPIIGTRSPTTPCATSRTSWRRTRHRPASSARSRPAGPSGRSKARWTTSRMRPVRIRSRCG